MTKHLPDSNYITIKSSRYGFMSKEDDRLGNDTSHQPFLNKKTYLKHFNSIGSDVTNLKQSVYAIPEKSFF